MPNEYPNIKPFEGQVLKSPGMFTANWDHMKTTTMNGDKFVVGCGEDLIGVWGCDPLQ